MRKGKFAFAAWWLVATAGCSRWVTARLGQRKREGRLQGGVDLRRAAQRRRLVAGARPGPALRAEDARQQGADDVQGEHRGRGPAPADRREPRQPGLQDDLRHVVRLLRQEARREVPERALRAGDGHRHGQEPVRVLRRRRGHGLPLRHGRGSGDEEEHDRLRRRVPDPRGDPPRERVRARRAGDAPGRQGQARVDELVVRPVEGEEGRGEPAQCGRRRARPERRLARDRPVRRVGRDPVGRLRLERAEVRAEVLADRRRLQLGQVLPEARARPR